MAKVYRLKLQTIFENLAVEERLLRDAPVGSLLLYSSRPCVVLGRNQVPWKKDHNKNANSEVVRKALTEQLNISADVNERNDILVDGRKVSGSAYRITRGRAYHHGTMLVNSNIENLENSILSPELNSIQSRATESVRSKVLNLAEKKAGINVESVSDALEATFRKEYDVTSDTVYIRRENLTDEDIEEIGSLKEKDWVFGKSPAFSVSYEMNFQWGKVEANFKVARGGKIADAEFIGPKTFISIPFAAKYLIDCEYGGNAMSTRISRTAMALQKDRNFLLDIAIFLAERIPNAYGLSAAARRKKPTKSLEMEPVEI